MTDQELIEKLYKGAIEMAWFLTRVVEKMETQRDTIDHLSRRLETTDTPK